MEPAHRLEATRGTSGTPRHTRLTRYRCSLPGLAGFAGNRCTEPEVPPIGSHRAKISAHKTAPRSLAQRPTPRKPLTRHALTHHPIKQLFRPRTKFDFHSPIGVSCRARKNLPRDSCRRCLRKHHRANPNPANLIALRPSRAIKSAASGPPGAAGRSTAWTPSSTR